VESSTLAGNDSLGVASGTRSEEDDTVALGGLVLNTEALALEDSTGGLERNLEVSKVDDVDAVVLEVIGLLPREDIANTTGGESLLVEAEGRGSSGIGEDNLGGGSLEAVDHRDGLNGSIGHDGNSAEQVNCSKGDDPSSAVEADNTNRVVATDAAGSEPRSNVNGAALDFGKGEDLALRDGSRLGHRRVQEDAVRELVHLVEKVGAERRGALRSQQPFSTASALTFFHTLVGRPLMLTVSISNIVPGRQIISSPGSELGHCNDGLTLGERELGGSGSWGPHDDGRKLGNVQEAVTLRLLLWRGQPNSTVDIAGTPPGAGSDRLGR